MTFVWYNIILLQHCFLDSYPSIKNSFMCFIKYSLIINSQFIYLFLFSPMKRLLNYNILKITKISVKMLLLSLIIYSQTPYSVNPKQKEVDHPYQGVNYIYFTNISCFFTAVTTLIGFTLFYKDTLISTYNFLLSSVIGMNIITTITFWGLYFIKKNLIVKSAFLKKGYGTYLLTELSLHFFPLLLSVIEQTDIMLVKSKYHSVVFLIFLILYYTFVTFEAHSRDRVYLYPFLTKMSEVGRIVFFLGITSALIGIHILVIKLNNMYHNKISTLNR